MTETPSVPPVSRRDAVITASRACGCLAGLAVGAAGCSPGGATTPAPSVPSGLTPAASAVEAPTVLAPAASIPVGGGTVFAQQRIVVTQPHAGTFAAFSAICTHEGCLVSQVNNSTIDCPCHGSRYSITDGSVVRGPAVHPLHSRTVHVTDGEILLTP